MTSLHTAREFQSIIIPCTVTTSGLVSWIQFAIAVRLEIARLWYNIIRRKRDMMYVYYCY